METILGLLLILLPLIFKAVEKKLQASGKPVKRTGDDTLPREEVYGPVFEKPYMEREVSGDEPSWIPDNVVVKETPAVRDFTETREKAVSRRQEKSMKPAVEKGRGRKIEPKNLILYSEIMKPKYMNDEL